MHFTVNDLVTLLHIKRRMVKKFYQIYPMTKKEKSEKAGTYLPTKFKVLMLFINLVIVTVTF